MAELSLNQGIQGINMTPVNTKPTWRGLIGDIFLSENNAEEDWARAEQQANNQLYRDLYYMQEANKFNMEEAQKSRDFTASESEKARQWQEEMRNSNYQAMVDDLKKAGLNPVMAFDGGGSSTPTASSVSGTAASSSNSRSSANKYTYRSEAADLVGTLLNVFSGLYKSGADNATKVNLGKMKFDSSNNYQITQMARDSKWRQWYDKNRK